MTKRNKSIMAILAATAAFGGLATMAPAQGSEVRQAINAGIVGETSTGYLGFAQTPSGELRAQVDAINLGRRSAFADLAQQRGTTRQQVAEETACNRLASVNPGQVYQLRDGAWRTRGAAPIATPSYC
jgi:uncharacterized protein YdbL (DUF1318 family)